ncbi:MAG: hypothetical protein A2Y18_06810 [Clostridiales bacterium GWD2_32_19]|nr:MAG: hypothetical protein A2Y18_06810 [Clostridiales bacterium GWD2_32_19]
MLKTVTGGKFSTPFFIEEGTYIADEDNYWKFGTWSPVIGVEPAKAEITITDVYGEEYTVENTNLTAESDKDWVDLFDLIGIPV